MATTRTTRPATSFTVSMPRPGTHLYEIAMDLTPFRRAVRSFDLCLPVWTPGSYLIREYERHVEDVSAKDEAGRARAIAKAKSWSVTSCVVNAFVDATLISGPAWV